MQSTAKAIALSRDLADVLRKRFAGGAAIDTVREAFDSAGWPMIFLSDGGVETASNPVILIRIKGVDMGSKDVFGNATTAYAPHTLEFAYELAAANNPTPTDVNLFTAAFEAIKTGVRFQLKEIANATAVTQAAIDAKSADTDLEDINWPTKSV